jgi:uncharacterized surface protein with fasciclin (FAS1) repeats
MKKAIHIYLFSLFLILFSSLSGRSQNPDKRLMEQIGANRPLLKETLVQAGLSPLLMDGGPYTFFAPSDEVLQKIKNTDPGKLKAILMDHIISGRFLKDDFKDGSKLKTLSGREVSVFRKGNNVLINGTKIIEPDLVANNGVMHTVNNLLVNP